MKRIIVAIVMLAGCMRFAAVAGNYTELPGLGKYSGEGAALLDRGSRISGQEKSRVLEVLRQGAREGDLAADYLLGVIYSRLSDRYQPFYDIILEEYNETYSATDADPYAFDDVTLPDYGLTDTEKPPFSSYRLDRAVDFYTAAASGKYLPAMNNLAYIYANRYADATKYARAMELYTEAANLGSAEAAANLGTEYFRNGRNGREDYAEALKWLEKAVDMGNRDPDALLCLGYCYEKGLGTARNVRKAVQTYEMGLGDYKSGKFVGSPIWNFSIPARLAILYYSDPDVLDYDKAFPLLKAVADQNLQETGDVRGFILRALYASYLNGRGTAPDREQAEYYRKEAARFGNPDAKKALQYLAPK